jgi:hypothetical protein
VPISSTAMLAGQRMITVGRIEKALRDSGGVRSRSLPETSDPVEPAQYHESALANSFRHGGSVPAIWARANGQQTRAIGLSWTDEYQAVIAMPGPGTVEDLYPRRCGSYIGHIPAGGTDRGAARIGRCRAKHPDEGSVAIPRFSRHKLGLHEANDSECGRKDRGEARRD